jgi:Domain of unknown function (DUF1841)
MFTPSTQDVRRFFCQTWAKMQSNSVLTPLEAMASDWLLEHPEYQSDLANEQAALERDYSVGSGQQNPFLHLSMHLSIAEQLSIDQPRGIKALYTQLARQLGSQHEAAHAVMDCLGEMLWTSQRNKTPPDGEHYLQCIARKAG